MIPLKIGLMGAGSVADFGHAPAIVAIPETELFSVLDPVFEHAVDLQKKFGGRHAFHDPDMFFKFRPDAVTICSPMPSHRENVLACAEQGLPVLCEKPLAMTDDDGEEMIAAMAEKGLPLAVGFCYRFSPVAMKIKELVASGQVGEIRSLRIIYIWDLHGIYETMPGGERVYSPRRAARMEEGGPMVDCGVHQVDLARWWLGSDVAEWSAAGAWVEDYDAPDHMHLHLMHESGVLSTIEMSFTYCHTAKEPISQFVYELIGTKGIIRYDRNGGLFEVRSEDGTVQLPWAHEKNFEGMYQAWAHALATGSMGDMPTGQDGLTAVRITREATEKVMKSKPKALLKQAQAVSGS